MVQKFLRDEWSLTASDHSGLLRNSAKVVAPGESESVKRLDRTSIGGINKPIKTASTPTSIDPKCDLNRLCRVPKQQADRLIRAQIDLG